MHGDYCNALHLGYRGCKVLDWSKFKAFADDKIKLPMRMIFVFDRLENIVRKEENAGYQHSYLSHNVFKML